MHSLRSSFVVVVLLSAFCFHGTLRAGKPPASGALFDFNKIDLSSLKVENGAEVSEVPGGLKISLNKAGGYPGVNFPIPGGEWNLSEFGGVEAMVVNEGKEKIGAGLRVDNEGDWKKGPWNSQTIWLEPGAEGTVLVVFGESYGKPGYDLDSGKISAIKLMATDPSAAGALVVKSLKAVGKPKTKPTHASASDTAAAPAAALGDGVAAQPLVTAALLESLALKPSSGDVTTKLSEDGASPGLVVTIQPGSDGYPGIEFQNKSGAVWNLSNYGHVEARVTNLGTKKLGVNLRLDNNGDWKLNPFNAESVYIGPGESGKVSVIFGYTYGKKPGYPLKASEISKILIFTAKSAEPQTIRIDSIQASGPAGEKPPVDPNSVRVTPKDGFLFGNGIAFDAAKQTVAKEGATAGLGTDGKSLKVTFSKKGQAVTLKPAMGMWDLREGNEVRVKVKNVGTTAVRPGLRVDSQPGPTDKIFAKESIAAGASGELRVSFIPAVPWLGIKDSAKTEWNSTAGTGTKFISDAASGVTLISDEAGGEQVLEIESVILAAPPTEVPSWLGKRPPVEGDWVPTFSDEFDGDKIDLKKWNIYTPNYWDKLSHFSKDNVLVSGGKATLRYEKKTGRHNDDPNGKETPYATGFIDTYGKWVQRYGYFEARMKLPKAPGLWPAMWLMPDRGLAEGEQWKRADTGRNGMEFDIMEYLSRWGVYRYNIAFHWDGYGKEHKQTGTTTIYVDHDKDGYITTGLLWLPNLAVIYNNGKEVARWESPRISNIPSDLMFTHVMGGWDNNGLDDKQLPDDFVIDYVRCWQRKDLASDLDGVKSIQETPAGPTTPDAVPATVPTQN